MVAFDRTTEPNQDNPNEPRTPARVREFHNIDPSGYYKPKPRELAQTRHKRKDRFQKQSADFSPEVLELAGEFWSYTGVDLQDNGKIEFVNERSFSTHIIPPRFLKSAVEDRNIYQALQYTLANTTLDRGFSDRYLRYLSRNPGSIFNFIPLSRNTMINWRKNHGGEDTVEKFFANPITQSSLNDFIKLSIMIPTLNRGDNDLGDTGNYLSNLYRVIPDKANLIAFLIKHGMIDEDLLIEF